MFSEYLELEWLYGDSRVIRIVMRRFKFLLFIANEIQPNRWSGLYSTIKYTV